MFQCQWLQVLCSLVCVGGGGRRGARPARWVSMGTQSPTTAVREHQPPVDRHGHGKATLTVTGPKTSVATDHHGLIGRCTLARTRAPHRQLRRRVHDHRPGGALRAGAPAQRRAASRPRARQPGQGYALALRVVPARHVERLCDGLVGRKRRRRADDARRQEHQHPAARARERLRPRDTQGDGPSAAAVRCLLQDDQQVRRSGLGGTFRADGGPAQENSQVRVVATLRSASVMMRSTR